VRFVFLGTSGAVPGPDRDTTFIVFEETGAPPVLVDCGGSPAQKLMRAGVDPVSLGRVIVTHIHPDHAYGLPSLIQTLFLTGRRAPLRIACREEHEAALRSLLGLFQLLERPGMFPLVWEPVPPREGFRLDAADGLAVTASPNAHGSMPNLAVRFQSSASGAAVVYSSDTEPCGAVETLARDAHTLIHEATFSERRASRFGAHSTAAQAGEVAARAGVRRLLLAHIDAGHHGELEALVEEARQHFSGEVEVARELVPYTL
jgi:ribonuclease Z